MKKGIMLVIFLSLSSSINILAENRCFNNYKEVFSHIATAERIVPSNEIYDLTADSTVHRFYSHSKRLEGWIIVIEANLFGLQKYNKVRGAQLNGRYYVFHVKEKCFYFLGQLEGKMLEAEYEEGLPIFKTVWHLSAEEVPRSVYKFNGTEYVRSMK